MGEKGEMVVGERGGGEGKEMGHTCTSDSIRFQSTSHGEGGGH